MVPLLTSMRGFNSGEKTEMYWAIRAHELAIEEGLNLYVYRNLDFVYKKSGYDRKFRTGHYDGKGRIGDWILAQSKDNGEYMGAAICTSGPYIEMSIANTTVMSPTIENGVATWRFQLRSGAVVHTALEDCGYYVRWLFDNQDRANGMDLEIAIAHQTYHEHARAFEVVTGHPAQFIDVSFDEFWKSGPFKDIANQGSGYNSDPNDPSFTTVKENFTGFFNMWIHSGENKGVIKRDYALLMRFIQRGSRVRTNGLERRMREGVTPVLEDYGKESIQKI